VGRERCALEDGFHLGILRANNNLESNTKFKHPRDLFT
jgi:hypothetical protein